MLTPADIEKKILKRGIGYNKKEVDSFISEIYEDYQKLYKENIEFKDKISVLNDGLQYYKSIEKTLQKALILAQKTADDNHADALKKAKIIEREALIKADTIVKNAKLQLDTIKEQTGELIKKYEVYKSQYKTLASTQLELLDSENFKLTLKDINDAFWYEELPGYDEPIGSIEDVAEERETLQDIYEQEDPTGKL